MMNITNILVPVDFSPPSRLALNHGIAFARKLRAHLTVLNVVETTAAAMYAFPVESAKIDTEHEEQARRMLCALVAPEDQDDLDLRVLIRQGDIHSEIVSAIAQDKADMVVMGTHGRGLFGRAFIGSVTQHLLRKVHVPVLTVCHVSRPLQFERILYATDLSDSSAAGFLSIVELAAVTRSRVTLLHAIDTAKLVSQTRDAIVNVDLAQIRTDADSHLKALSADAASRNIPTDVALVEGKPPDAILKAAEDGCSDLIAITIGKKGLLERALLGATAERLIREAHVPVLSIPVM
jgi:nucleotide-binding universal stress UspA family protein